MNGFGIQTYNIESDACAVGMLQLILEMFDLGQEEFVVGDKLSVGIHSPERTLATLSGCVIGNGRVSLGKDFDAGLLARSRSRRRSWGWQNSFMAPKGPSATRWKSFYDAPRSHISCRRTLPRSPAQGATKRTADRRVDTTLRASVRILICAGNHARILVCDRAMSLLDSIRNTNEP